MSFLEKINRFASTPIDMNMKRTKFNLSHGVKTTFNSGDLVPILVDEILPDDTIKIDVSSVVRSITPAVPVMDNAYLDIYAFWCPARILTIHDKDWQKIHGENVAGYWAPSSESTIMNTGNSFTFKNSSYKCNVQSLADYLSIPVNFYHSGIQISRLPFNGYWEIYNQWFRDQNVSAPIDWKSFTNDQCATQAGVASNLCKVNRLHDFFSSCLPAPQKGSSVLLPLAGSAPVKGGAVHTQATDTWNDLKWVFSNNTYIPTGSVVPLKVRNYDSSSQAGGDTGVYNADIASGGSLSGLAAPSNLWADLTNATTASINDLRQGFAIQKLLERDARSGSRYREMLKAHFGVSVPDNTVQVPEYLGGKRIPLNMLQVLQTTPTSASPTGSTGAFSNTADNSYLFTKSFTEFGYLYILACVRTNQSYSQGISKMFTRTRRYDFYYPVFANLGEMPVYKYELFADNNSILPGASGAIFGYQEAWAEYRYKPTKITGYLSANSGDSVAQAWTYGNKFSSAPTLNDTFMKQDRTLVDNTLVVSNSNYQFIGDFFIGYRAWRAMPYFSIPGLIDHH